MGFLGQGFEVWRRTASVVESRSGGSRGAGQRPEGLSLTGMAPGGSRGLRREDGGSLCGLGNVSNHGGQGLGPYSYLRVGKRNAQ